MSYDAASFKAGFALGRRLWRPLIPPPAVPHPFHIPDAGPGTTEFDAMNGVFDDTGGTPQINRTYYTDHPTIQT